MGRRDRNSEGRQLDAMVDLTADVEDLTDDEVVEELLAEGIAADIGSLVRRRLHQRTWRDFARQDMATQVQTVRPKRPAHANAAFIIQKIQTHRNQQQTAFAFKGVEEMSADELWGLLCDLEELDGE